MVSPHVTTIPSADRGHALLPPKSSASPCATSACDAKPCARHMHRSLLSLNSGLGQPLIGKNIQIMLSIHMDRPLWKYWVIVLSEVCSLLWALFSGGWCRNIAQYCAVIKCDQNDGVTVWVYIWNIIIYDLVAAERKGMERNSWCKLDMTGCYTLKFRMIEEVSLFVTKAIVLSSK